MEKLSIRNQEKYQEFVDYLQRHEGEIINYEKRKEVGGVIGACRREKANDTIIAQRQKNGARAWFYMGSTALATIVAKYINQSNIQHTISYSN